ncbi:hypothetical protein D9M69_588600 [compost metagenome]
MIAGQVIGNESAQAGIYHRFLHQSHAYSAYYSPGHLVSGGLGVNDLPAVCHANIFFDLHLTCSAVNTELHKMGRYRAESKFLSLLSRP